MQNSSYKLIAKKGQGGMAEVFKAAKSGPDGFSKTVALKKILPIYSDQPQFIKMLSAEAKINSYLNHPNIVQILDFFEENGQYSMIMEYVDGENLKELINSCKAKNQELPWQACLYIALETLKALSYAHTKEGIKGHLHIIHRDINPQNILISYQGEVKLTDFGIARAKIERDETASGILKGKYRYLSPEQILNEPLTPASDLFSLGVTLYEMLSFQHPFGETQEYQTLQKIVDQPHRPLSELNSKLNPKIVHVVEQALQKNPKNRYQNAKDFYEDLLELQDPNWVTHGKELLETFIVKLIPTEQRKDVSVEKTSVLTDIIKTQHSFLNTSKINFFSRWGLKQWTTIIIIPFFLGLGLAYYVKLKKSHFQPIAQSALIQSESTSKTQIENPVPEKKLKFKILKPQGQIELAGPENTEVYINGKKIGLLPIPVLSLPTGTYMILLQNAQLGKKIKTVRLVENRKSRVSWE